MIVDYKKGIYPSHQWVPPTNFRIWVDGVEIHRVWYIDTREGIVKSYDIQGRFGVANNYFHREDYPADWEFDLTDDVVSRVYRGKVEYGPR